MILQLQIEIKGEQGHQSTDRKPSYVLFHVSPFFFREDLQSELSCVCSKLKPLVTGVVRLVRTLPSLFFRATFTKPFEHLMWAPQ